MAKASVLGNDPFLRGAAVRPLAPEPEPEPEPAPPAAPAPVEPERAAEAPSPVVPEPEPVKKKAAQKPAKKPRAPRQPKPPQVFEGVLVDQIPRLPPATSVPSESESAPQPGWLAQARAAASGLAGSAVQAVLANNFAQRAATATRPAIDVALRLLPPAASATRFALSAVMNGEAMRGLLATVAEAGAALKQATKRSEPGQGEVDAFGEDPSVLSRAEPLFDFLHDRYFRVEALSPERLPEGACVLVCNHSGVLPLDGPMIRTVLRRECGRSDARWLVEDALFHAPFIGTLLNRLGAVRACPENAERLLDDDVPLAVFPEGFLGISKPMSRRYQLQRFGRGGFVKLALRAKVPIVPVAIVGAEEASPLWAKLPFKALGLPYFPLTPLVPLPSKWTVSFLEPITVKRGSAKDAEDPARVAQLTAQTRDAIQHELDRLVAERRSVLTG